MNKMASMMKPMTTGQAGGRMGKKGTQMNRMLISLLSTIGVSAALYALRRYQNGKWLRPVQNVMEKFTAGGTQNMMGMQALANPIAELSEELTPNRTPMNQNQEK
ncbi:MAG TPA: hypothetical protein VIG80_01970 [Bacillaceae bacterium]